MEQKIKELTNKLNEYGLAYYSQNDSLISDYDYDIMYRELVELESKYPNLKLSYSPTHRVGSDISNDFKKIEHKAKMDSLQDAFSFDEVEKFYNNINEKTGKETTFVIERKIDGLSVSLTYENGIFVKGATRGNGIIGEDVTENLKTIKSIPLKIKTELPLVEVRGEVFMDKNVFNELNDEQIEKGMEPFKNPRNAAAGSLRQKLTSVVAKRKLDMFIFNLQRIEGKIIESHQESLLFLKELGFNVSPNFKVVKSFDEICKTIDEIGNKRLSLPYEIDGAVVKVDDFDLRKNLGYTDKTPKWAVAFKYPPEEQTSKLLDIEINVGRTGVLTPTAVFEEIQLAGTSVSRAVLHNQDFINEKQIKIGDIVVVRKAGDIIPEIVKVKEHNENGEVFQIPSICPSCGEKTVNENGESAIKCINSLCPSQIYRNIVHFASRDAMNIDGLGERIVKTLIDSNLVNRVDDLYKLCKEQILELEGFKEKSANNLIESITKSKGNAFNQVVFGLGIPNIGKKASKQLTDKFKNIDNLMNATMEEILEIDGFGEIMAQSITGSFQNKTIIDVVDNLKNMGVNLETEETNDVIDTDNVFYGKTFVVTGTFANRKRKEIEEIISKFGGKVSSAVSKNTDFLLAGEKAGSKLEKAQNLGIKIIAENDFEKMI